MMYAMISGAALPELGWQGHDSGRYDPQLWEAIEDRPGFTAKPHGGLWSSPMHPEGGTHWTQWCLVQEYGNPGAPITQIIPDPDASVLVIDSVEGLLALEAAYPGTSYARAASVDMFPDLSWNKIAADFDAVWLTEAGQWRTRFSRPGLYGWDCETVLWLQPRFTPGEVIEC